MKYERKCTNCGRTDNYYAKGLCRACYGRLRRNGTFEKQYLRGVGSRPYMWSDNTKKILELYHDGMRQVDIVKEVGLTRQEVSLVIKKYAKPTNADRIRAMTNEELAKFMALNTDCYYCRAKDNDRCASLATTPCGDIWLDWLKQEATNG